MKARLLQLPCICCSHLLWQGEAIVLGGRIPIVAFLVQEGWFWIWFAEKINIWVSLERVLVKWGHLGEPYFALKTANIES